jgi:hypothetical protein
VILFVDKRFEISNTKIFRDINEIISDAECDKNLEMLRFISEQTEDRGIHFQPYFILRMI